MVERRDRKATDGSLTPESEDDGDIQLSRILLLRPLCGPLRRPPRTSAGAKLSGLELHEDDVFWIGFGPSSIDPVGHGSPGPVPPDAMGSPNYCRTLSSLSGAGPGSSCITLLSSGIIAALSEDPSSAQTSPYGLRPDDPSDVQDTNEELAVGARWGD